MPRQKIEKVKEVKTEKKCQHNFDENITNFKNAELIELKCKKCGFESKKIIDKI